MLRRILQSIAAILALAACGGLGAQTLTQVSGTITDPNGLAYSNATITIALTPQGGASPTLTPCTNPVGCSFTIPSPIVTNTSGSFTVALYANASILPASTQYAFTVNEPGIPAPLGTGPQTFTYTVTISGASQSVSTGMSALAAALSHATGGAPSGPAGGDLGGTYPNPTVLHLSHVTDGSLANSGLANPGTTVNGTLCTLGSTCSPSTAPSGAAGGDLGGTYPNPTVVNLANVSNASLANAGLAHPSTTVNGTLCTLGSTCSPAPGGTAGGDLGGTYPNPTVVNLSNVNNGSLANVGLAHPSTTVNGTTCTLGSTCTVPTAGGSPTLSSSPITAEAIPTTVVTISVNSLTFPSTGGPFRASIAYQVPFTFTSSVTNVDCWVTDGTNNFVPMTTANSNGAAGGHTNGNAAGWSSVAYMNGATVTFNLDCQGNVAGSDTLASGPTSGVAGAFQILPVATNALALDAAATGGANFGVTNGPVGPVAPTSGTDFGLLFTSGITQGNAYIQPSTPPAGWTNISTPTPPRLLVYTDTVSGSVTPTSVLSAGWGAFAGVVGLFHFNGSATLVQSASLGFSASGAQSLPFTSNITAGNTVLLALGGNFNANLAPTSISDSLGNVYKLVDIENQLSSGLLTTQGVAVYYAQNVIGGACTVNFTVSSVNTYNAWIGEINGFVAN